MAEDGFDAFEAALDEVVNPASPGGAESAPADPLLTDLTGPQREAVTHTEGPLLVLAAAGSGKTRVITRRIAHLIRNGIPPWSVLALTFTNKAAGEMRERVLGLLADDPRLTRGLTVTTFHSLCARLLRRYAGQADLPGLRPDFTIYPSADQLALMKRVVQDAQLATSNWPPRSVLAAISNAKNELIDAERFAGDAADFYSKTIARLYLSYTRALHSAGALDFDDLLLMAAKMLRDRPAIRAECLGRWQYLLIDEYQDTNHVQFVIASLLASGGRSRDRDLLAGLPGVGDAPFGLEDSGTSPAVAGEDAPNICVVGDPDQAIYGWRGADITNILEFEERFPSTRVIALGQNFRSTTPILANADALIRHNVRRKHKPLFTEHEGGEDVEVLRCGTEHDEARAVVEWFEALAEDGTPAKREAGLKGLAWRDMAVFYRTNALSRVMEDELRSGGIPYVIARGTAFYEREEVRSALAYLRVAANTADDVSLLRVINTPTRGIGKTTIAHLQAFASSNSLTLFGAMRRAGEVEGLSARAVNSVTRFVEMVDGWTGAGKFMGGEVAGSLAELGERVVRESGLEAMYKKQAAASGSETDEERLENLDEVVSSVAQFETEYAPDADPAQFDAPSPAPGGGGGRVSEPGGGPLPLPSGERVDRSSSSETGEGSSSSPAPAGEAGESSSPEGALPNPPLLSMLRAYLESVALVADADAIDPTQGAVTLMTLHAAKGLEFPAVAMIGLEEGLLPHARSNQSDEMLEEERRLCFVGITRAMRRLTITSARYRTHRGMPERTIASRFLEELDPDHCRVRDRDDEPIDDFDAAPTGAIGGSPMDRAGTDLASQFPEGATVRHPQFGVGVIVTVSRGRYARARVRFRDVGEKTLILEYARLTRTN